MASTSLQDTRRQNASEGQGASWESLEALWCGVQLEVLLSCVCADRFVVLCEPGCPVNAFGLASCRAEQEGSKRDETNEPHSYFLLLISCILRYMTCIFFLCSRSCYFRSYELVAFEYHNFFACAQNGQCALIGENSSMVVFFFFFGNQSLTISLFLLFELLSCSQWLIS